MMMVLIAQVLRRKLYLYLWGALETPQVLLTVRN